MRRLARVSARAQGPAGVAALAVGIGLQLGVGWGLVVLGLALLVASFLDTFLGGQ